jgi:hypothetical protein
VLSDGSFRIGLFIVLHSGSPDFISSRTNSRVLESGAGRSMELSGASDQNA